MNPPRCTSFRGRQLAEWHPELCEELPRHPQICCADCASLFLTHYVLERVRTSPDIAQGYIDCIQGHIDQTLPLDIDMRQVKSCSIHRNRLTWLNYERRRVMNIRRRSGTNDGRKTLYCKYIELCCSLQVLSQHLISSRSI